MAIRISGLNSGLDTDAIVQELVSAYSLKTEKYEKAQTKLTWKQDAWKSLNTKIYGLYTNVSNLRFSSAYNLRKVSVSDNTKAKITATSDAVTGTQKLNILQTAQSAYITGGQLGKEVTGKTKLSELGFTDKEASIQLKKNDGTTETIKVTADTTVSDFANKLKEVGLNASFDANNHRLFVSAKESGVSADFSLVGINDEGEAALSALGLNVAMTTKDENGNVIFAQSAAAYKEAYNRFYTKATDTNGDGVIDVDDVKAYINEQITKYEDLQKEWNVQNGKYLRTSAENRELQEKYDAYKQEYLALDEKYGDLDGDGVGDVDVDARIAELDAIVTPLQEALTAATDNRTAAQANADAAQTAADEAQANVDAAQAKVDGLNQQISELDTTADDYADSLAALQEQLVTAEEELTTACDELTVAQSDLVTAQTELADAETAYTTAEDNLAAHEAEATELEELKRFQELPTIISETESTINANHEIITAAETAMKDAKDGQAALDIDEFMAIKNDKDGTEEENQTRLDRAIYEMADKAVKANEILTDTTGTYSVGKATKIDATDAVIELNGVHYTNSTNSFSINGLNIEALATTGAGVNNAVQVTTNVDAQGIYDKIKDFLTEYNTVINEMTKLYNAESASDYEPLTDEEKEAMSDDQIEKWETKIKDSLLRRDTTLNGVMSAMVNSMASVFEINGEKVSLSTFGISTLGFLNAAENEHYAFHIDGDEDDENTSGKKDKLMAAIEEDPDKVMEFMKQLTGNLYSAIDKKMKSTELSSAYKVYNDKEMDREQTEYEELISKWEEKIKDKEDYYYNKFTQMEKAMANLNSQTSSLSGLLGMNS